MDARGGYGQFCPVSMAAEILCPRWTLLLLREMCAGSTHFNELRKGVPRMSPTLLSKRLKDLEIAGVVERVAAGGPGAPGGYEYRLTAAGQELRPIIHAIGLWGQRWVETRNSLKNLDPSLLMWDMRRNLDPTPLPRRRCVIHFLYPELPPRRQRWWLVIGEDGTDLCEKDPGFEVDLYVTTDLRTMTAIWMGLASVETEMRAGRLELDGDRAIARSMQRWLGLSSFAGEKKLARA